MRSENLRPQDVLVACKVFSQGILRIATTYGNLSADLGMSTSTVYEATERCRRSQLLQLSTWKVSTRLLRDLIVHAVPRVFYAVRGSMAVGTPTSVHAAVLSGRFKVAPGAVPVVWCEADPPAGLPRGEGIEPLYHTVPASCRLDNVLYELMALADVMRVGTASERATAVDILDRRLSSTT